MSKKVEKDKKLFKLHCVYDNMKMVRKNTIRPGCLRGSAYARQTEAGKERYRDESKKIG